MLCFRVSVGDLFLGLVHRGDVSLMQVFVTQYGRRLSVVPVVIL